MEWSKVTDPEAVRQAIAEFDRLGRRPPTPNELRHTGLSLLADQGAPNELLAQLAGHRSTRMVDEVYRHRIRPSVDTAVTFDWLT